MGTEPAPSVHVSGDSGSAAAGKQASGAVMGEAGGGGGGARGAGSGEDGLRLTSVPTTPRGPQFL